MRVEYGSGCCGRVLEFNAFELRMSFDLKLSSLINVY